MIENPYEAPKASDDFAAALGPVVLICRNRSWKDRMLYLGQSSLYVYMAPFWLSLFSTLILSALIVKLGLTGGPPVFRVVFVSCYFLCLSAFAWLLFRAPRKPS